MLFVQETRLSVALVTRNRPASLERTLKSLRAQSVQPWNVIISDDSDADQAAELLREHISKACASLLANIRK